VAAEPDYTISDHAAYEIERRGIKIETIDQVLKNPDQRFDVRPRRVVLQSRIQEASGEFLIRVFIDIDRKPAEVVTAYRTRARLQSIGGFNHEGTLRSKDRHFESRSSG
jgi:Domain of unknown function (DUF4258)